MAKTEARKIRDAGERRRNRDLCPHPYKDAYPSHATATHALNKAWGQLRIARAMPVRSYKCECGAWHLTKQPKNTDRHQKVAA